MHGPTQLLEDGFMTVSLDVRVPPHGLLGTLHIPEHVFALVIFAQNGGSGRPIGRDGLIAEALNRRGIATLLLDLRTRKEGKTSRRAKASDIPVLAERLADAIQWTEKAASLKGLRVGLFGADTAAAAALMAAAKLGPRVGAVVSCSGRPDLAGDALMAVRAPTLLIVGGADRAEIASNKQTLARLRGPKELVVVPRATHLLAEPDAIEQVSAQAGRWFKRHLRAR